MARIKKDDRVMVIAGKDKGQVGRVLRMAKGGKRIFIEKLNMVKRHTRPTQQHPQGGIIDKEASIDLSNVMLVASGDRPVRVGYQLKDTDGGKKKIRIAKQTGDAI